METEKFGNCGKKQYFILLVLSVVTALLIPLICDILDVFLLLKNPMNSFGTSANIILYVVLFSQAVGLAVLIFTAMRFRFKLCLPFVGVGVFAAISSFIVNLAVMGANKSQAYLLAVGISDILQTCALLFAFVGITKFCAKFIKKEIIAVPVSILIIEIANWLIDSLLSVFYTLLLRFFNPMNEAPLYYNNITNISGKMSGLLIKTFSYFICLNIAYLIIRLFFAKNKREKLYKIAVAVKATVKKLWQSTAK